MAKILDYCPEGTCCRLMRLTVEDGRLLDVEFVGGCHGNLQGIASLVRGMSCKEVINRLEGIRCSAKPTSCPDQLSRALKQILEETV